MRMFASALLARGGSWSGPLFSKGRFFAFAVVGHSFDLLAL
jgi:hypothetical protein